MPGSYFFFFFLCEVAFVKTALTTRIHPLDIHIYPENVVWMCALYYFWLFLLFVTHACTRPLQFVVPDWPRLLEMLLQPVRVGECSFSDSPGLFGTTNKGSATITKQRKTQVVTTGTFIVKSLIGINLLPST